MPTATQIERPRKLVPEQKTSPRPAPQKHRRRWRLWGTLAALALLVWLLPPIAAHTPLLGWAVNKFAGLNGTAEIQSASLGWFSPVAASGIAVKDKQGKTVVSLGSLVGERSLAAILCDYMNLGRYHLGGLKVSVVLRDDGSNVEDLLANYLATSPQTPQPAKPSAGFALGLDIADGSVTIADQTIGQSWQLNKLAVSLDLPKDPVAPLAVQASIELADVPAAAGSGAANPQVAKFAAGLKWASAGGAATLKIDQFPLAVLRPLADRLISRGTRLTGRLSSDLNASWGGTDGKNSAAGGVNLEGFSLAMPALLGADVVQLDRLQSAVQASWQPDRVNIEKATLDCDVASFSAAGTIPLGQQGGFSLASLLRQRQELGGRLDLAGIARLLPATLHLKQNLRIDSGQVQLAFSSQPQQQGAAWHGQLDTTPLSATADGRQIAWQQPISVVLDAHDTPQGAVVDNLRCQSDFLDVRAAGTPDDLNATINLSLNQLADHLGQFSDLGGLQLAGQGGGTVNWKRTQPQFDAGGRFQLDGFQWAIKGKPAWREDSIVISAAAKGQTDPAGKTRLDAASLSVVTATDRLDASLTEPIADWHDFSAYAVHVGLQGQLQNWPSRLAAWLPPGSTRLQGAYNLQADAKAAAGLLHAQATARVSNLAILDSTGPQFQEPQIMLSVAGQYDSKSQSLDLEQVQLTSSMLAAGAAGRIAPAGGHNEGQFKGQINYDLERLCGLLRLGDGIHLTGRGTSDAWYRGPLAASDAMTAGQAEAGAKWDQADLGGISLGRGELKATMQNGGVQMTPLELTVGQGRVHLAPRLVLRPEPAMLTLPAGPLADNIQIDPAMCASMLKFAAPAIASVTSARGTFSIILDSCRIPLGDPKKSDVVGRLVIHSVEIGSGPMLGELSTLLSNNAPAKLKQESVVSFVVRDGKVHHEGLELQFPELTIRTSGDVGFDKTLNITAEMPVPPKWLAGNAAISQAMRNQVIRLPLRGVLDRPQIDQQEMARQSQQFIGQAVRQAAGNAIDQGINKGLNGLDQLLKPRK